MLALPFSQYWKNQCDHVFVGNFNIINVIGNFIGVLVLRAGVAGVAYPSLIARTFSAVMITVLCFQRKMKCSIAASGFSGGMWIS